MCRGLDAKAYVEWLSRRTGRDYRLPTEAEWEYAARAGTAGPYHTGSRLGPDRANYSGGGTKPAGSYPPNAFGLHDMPGNVWEWVEDCWNPSHAGAPVDGSARLSGDCNWRVLRGGSWLNGPESLRSTTRFQDEFGRARLLHQRLPRRADARSLRRGLACRG